MRFPDPELALRLLGYLWKMDRWSAVTEDLAGLESALYQVPRRDVVRCLEKMERCRMVTSYHGSVWVPVEPESYGKTMDDIELAISESEHPEYWYFSEFHPALGQDADGSGTWTCITPDGDFGQGSRSTFTGEMKDGVPEGTGFYSDRYIAYEGGYRDGLYEGHGRCTFLDSLVFEGEWRRGIGTKGRLTLPDGTIVESDRMELDLDAHDEDGRLQLTVGGAGGHAEKVKDALLPLEPYLIIVDTGMELSHIGNLADVVRAVVSDDYMYKDAGYVTESVGALATFSDHLRVRAGFRPFGELRSGVEEAVGHCSFRGKTRMFQVLDESVAYLDGFVRRMRGQGRTVMPPAIVVVSSGLSSDDAPEGVVLPVGRYKGVYIRSYPVSHRYMENTERMFGNCRDMCADRSSGQRDPVADRNYALDIIRRNPGGMSFDDLSKELYWMDKADLKRLVLRFVSSLNASVGEDGTIRPRKWKQCRL